LPWDFMKGSIGMDKRRDDSIDEVAKDVKEML